ncbi:unnamed protein product [Sphagnum jensenii]|uniref:Uncharacterized protein n=1 Tax=Sphagnum jensenii TaxID=128206 RepID=A0ABP0VW00_9BRYO
MALSNFLLSVVVVGAGYMLLRSDVRRSAVTLRSNLKHIKRWLEQETPSSEVKPKEVESGASQKATAKEEIKH